MATAQGACQKNELLPPGSIAIDYLAVAARGEGQQELDGNRLTRNRTAPSHSNT